MPDYENLLDKYDDVLDVPSNLSGPLNNYGYCRTYDDSAAKQYKKTAVNGDTMIQVYDEYIDSDNNRRFIFLIADLADNTSQIVEPGECFNIPDPPNQEHQDLVRTQLYVHNIKANGDNFIMISSIAADYEDEDGYEDRSRDYYLARVTKSGTVSVLQNLNGQDYGQDDLFEYDGTYYSVYYIKSTVDDNNENYDYGYAETIIYTLDGEVTTIEDATDQTYRGHQPRYFTVNNSDGNLYAFSECGEIFRFDDLASGNYTEVADAIFSMHDNSGLLAYNDTNSRAEYGYYCFDQDGHIYRFTWNSDNVTGSDKVSRTFNYDLELDMLTQDEEFMVAKVTDPILLEGTLSYEDGKKPTEVYDNDFYLRWRLNYGALNYYDENRFILDHKEIYKDSYYIYLPARQYITVPNMEFIGFQGGIPERDANIEDVYAYPNQDLNLERPSRDISTPEALFDIRYAPVMEYNITADLDLDNFTIPDHHPNNTWVTSKTKQGHFPPIGNFYSDDRTTFIAKINGNGYEINNLTFKSEQTVDNVGLFKGFYPGFHYGGTIFYLKNITLNNCDLKGEENVGCVAGYAGGDGANPYQLEGVEANGNVESATDAGGLVGYSENVNGAFGINESSFNGQVQATNSAGGLIGIGAAKISNSYARGSIDSPSRCAGLCGSYYTYSEKISNSYFAGTLNSATTTAPIATDDGFNPGDIENCYYDQEVIGISSFTTNTADEIGRNTSSMTYPHNKSTTYQGWDFDNIWYISPEKNEGYPVFLPDDLKNLTISNISNKTVKEGYNLNFNVNTNHPDESKLTFEALNDLTSYFTPSTHIFDYTPDGDDAGFYDITFRVGRYSFKITESVTIEVLDNPIFDVELEDITVKPTQTVSFKVLDNPENHPEINLSASGELANCYYSHSTYFEYTPLPEDLGEHSINIVVSDGTVSTDETVNITVEPYDTKIWIDGPLNKYLNPENRKFRWIPNFTEEGNYTAELHVEYEDDYSTVENINIDISNTLIKTLIDSISDQEANEQELVDFPVVTKIELERQ